MLLSLSLALDSGLALKAFRSEAAQVLAARGLVVARNNVAQQITERRILDDGK